MTTLYGWSVQLQFFIKGCSNLSCQTDDREAVRAVGGDFKLYLGIVKTDGFTNRHTQWYFFIQNKDTVLNSVGEVVYGQAQFAQRAEHTVAFYATEFAFFNLHTARQGGVVQCSRNNIAYLQVGSAGYNLDRRFCAALQLHDSKSFRQ